MKGYRRPYRIKKKKSIFGNRFFWLAILFLIICGGISYLIYFSSFFQIKEIRITGNQKVSAENLQKLMEEKIDQKVLFFSSKSIFLADLNKINETVLEKFPQIWQVNLKRRFPDTLIIEVEERKPVAIFSQAENYYFIDKEGIIFDPVRNDISNGAVERYLKLKNLTLTTALKLGEMAIKKELLPQILEINSKLKENLKIDIDEFIIPTEGRLNVKTIEGWELYFNLQEDIKWQLIKLKALLEKEIPPEKRKDLEYIELRFGNFANPKYKD